MKVKRIFMDLKEASTEQRSWRDVWVLESEAFKDPITIDIAYDDKDREFIEISKDLIEKQVKEAGKILQKIDDKESERKELISKYKEEVQLKEDKIKNLTMKLEKSEKEKVKVVQEANKIREKVEIMNGRIVDHEELINKLQKKVSKETRIFSGQTFISWNWNTALTTIQIPNGNYAVMYTYKILESNEYVENQEMEIGWYILHVNDNIFIPEYDLQGTTKLDTPTATIEWTFTLIPN